MTSGDKTLNEIIAKGMEGPRARWLGLRGGVPAYEMEFTTEAGLKGVIIGDKNDERGPVMFLDPSTRHKRRALIRMLVDEYTETTERIVVTKAFAC